MEMSFFDGLSNNSLAVARYSRKRIIFGRNDLGRIKNIYLVTNRELPTKHMFHCMWQYRPWDADWIWYMKVKFWSGK